jgi:hypothetical protein
MNYPARIENKIMGIFFIFLFAHVSFLLCFRLWREPFLTVPLGFGVNPKNRLSPQIITQIDNLVQFSAVQAFLLLFFFIVIQIFRNHLARAFLLVCNRLVERKTKLNSMV